MDIKEIDILGNDINNHWYYRSKAKAMLRMLGDTDIQSILDVGAGSGFFSQYLLKNSIANEAWCVDTSYSCDKDELISDKPIHYRRHYDPLSTDLVIMMDVLEHVDDDIELLRDYVNRVQAGTLFLISVPAFQFLWSSHDVFLEHKRRYNLKHIQETVKQAGLNIQRTAYYFSAVFPIAAFTRLIGNAIHPNQHDNTSQLKRHNLLVNEILAGFSHLELPIMFYNRFFGLTIFCLAKKL